MNEQAEATLGRYLRRALGYGAIGGLAAIYLVIVGIVPAFEARPLITGTLGLGLTVPLIAILVIAYLAGVTPKSWRAPSAGVSHRVLPPIVSGTLGGAGLALLITVEELLNPTAVLPQLTAQTAQIISLGLAFPLGAAAIIVASEKKAQELGVKPIAILRIDHDQDGSMELKKREGYF